MVELSKKLMPQGSIPPATKFCDGECDRRGTADCDGVSGAALDLWGRSIVPDATVFLWERIPFDANGEVEIHLKFIQTGR